MKEYKIDLSMYNGKVREVVSEAVQKKAFELGYGWINGGKSPNLLGCSLLFLENGHMLKDEAYHTEISAADFLALTTEDVKDAPKDPGLKPDQLVLAREGHGETWCLCHFSHRWENGRFCVGDTTCRYCIPYEGNEHLLGTTEDVK